MKSNIFVYLPILCGLGLVSESQALISSQQELDDVNGLVVVDMTKDNPEYWKHATKMAYMRAIESSTDLRYPELTVNMNYTTPHRRTTSMGVFILAHTLQSDNFKLTANIDGIPDTDVSSGSHFTGLKFRGEDEDLKGLIELGNSDINIKTKDLIYTTGINANISTLKFKGKTVINIDDEKTFAIKEVKSDGTVKIKEGELTGVYNSNADFLFNDLDINLKTNAGVIYGVLANKNKYLTRQDGIVSINKLKLVAENDKGASYGVIAFNGGEIAVGDNAEIAVTNIQPLVKPSHAIDAEAGSKIAFGDGLVARSVGNHDQQYVDGAVFAHARDDVKSRIDIGDNAQITSLNKGEGDAIGIQAKNAVITVGDHSVINAKSVGGNVRAVFVEPKGKVILGKDATIKTSAAGLNLGINPMMGGEAVLNGLTYSTPHGLFYSEGGSLTANPAYYQLEGDIINTAFTWKGDVTPGTMQLNFSDDSSFTGQIMTDSDSTTQLTLNKGAVWHLTGDSLLSDLNIADSNSRLVVHEKQSILQSERVRNAGIIQVSEHNKPFNELVVNANYIGDDGELLINTELNGDDSATDHVVFAGGTEGKTTVTVNNINGEGAQTVNGIEIIRVLGQADGQFSLKGGKPVSAGAYDYYLHDLKVQQSEEQAWVLMSQLRPEPKEPEEPEEIDGKDDSRLQQITYRPEFGTYIANNMLSNTLFNHRLHDRLGEGYYTDSFTGVKKATSMWMRHVGGHTKFKDSATGKDKANRYVVQLGGDLAQWTQEAGDRYHLGLMAGYAYASTKNTAQLTGNKSKGQVDGYSVGLYGTWYQNGESTTDGAYIDSWLLYNWFDNKVERDDNDKKYRAKGVTASIEGGYTVSLNDALEQGHRYFLQPQLQVIYMGVHAKDHTAYTQMDVSTSKDNVQTRLGVRGFMTGIMNQDTADFRPFAELNWLYNGKDFAATINGVEHKQTNSKHIAEIRLGAEGLVSKRTQLWGHVAQQIGNKSYSDTQALFGLKYTF